MTGLKGCCQQEATCTWERCGVSPASREGEVKSPSNEEVSINSAEENSESMER